MFGEGGNDTVAGGTAYDIILAGDGDDVLIADDDGENDDLYAGDGFDICLLGSGGDEPRADCEY